MTGRYTEGVSGLPARLHVTGPVTAAEMARARDLRRTRAMPPHQLLDGEIGNEMAAGTTTLERREELQAEADDRKALRATVGLEQRALELIDARVAGSTGRAAP